VVVVVVVRRRRRKKKRGVRFLGNEPKILIILFR
jgi:hypothetical protein